MQNSNHKLRKERIMWIDMARGVAMLSILLFHTDSYNFEELLIPYEYYVENFLALFFFISGFLFYSEREFDIKHKFKSISKTIILPYFIFTSCMSIPKAIVHGSELSTDLLTNIIFGQASWFVTALALAEIMFSFLIKISHKSRYIMPIVCIACGIMAVYITPSYNFWHFQNALLAMPYLYLGYLYHKYEIIVTWFVNNKVFVIAGTIFIVFIKYMEHSTGIRMLFEPVVVTSFLLFFIDTMMFITLCILLIKHIKPYKMICWTGRNSLVYYFLCGGVPLLTNKAISFLGINYPDNIAVLIVITAIVYFITSVITHFIVKYIPFVTGKF